MNREAKDLLKGVLRRLRVGGELLVWGGERREKVLLKMLGGFYDSLFRRSWVHSAEPPHYYSHRMTAFQFGFGHGQVRPEVLYRGFFSSEVIRKGDRVLDIGCGDGFFTNRFLAARASLVDGVDIEPTAIAEATKYNSTSNVRFSLVDAVKEPFPSPPYDAVVWDGALGHFGADDTVGLLSKIKGALGPDGVFVGSESLGHEGADHLQFFETLEDLGALFRPFWRHVLVREVVYPIGGNFLRREAYWRCCDDLTRLETAGWVAVTKDGARSGMKSVDLRG
jgi:SAM-dependent methyltransferase